LGVLTLNRGHILDSALQTVYHRCPTR